MRTKIIIARQGIIPLYATYIPTHRPPANINGVNNPDFKNPNNQKGRARKK